MAEQILNLEYISSDEDVDDDEGSRTIKRIPWESEQLSNVKETLDRIFVANASISQKRKLSKNISRQNGGPVSLRPVPKNIPGWAFKAV